MAKKWQTALKNWKKTLPLHKRLIYFIVGFPPQPYALPDETWDRWKKKFDAPEYDWSHHAGTVPKSQK